MIDEEHEKEEVFRWNGNCLKEFSTCKTLLLR